MDQNSDDSPTPERPIPPDSSGPNSVPPGNDASREKTPDQDAHAEAFFDLRSAVTRAWNSGADDARRTVENAVPQARSAAQQAAEELVYGLGYGSAFVTEVLDALVPDDMGSRSANGSEAGRRAAESFLQKMRDVATSPTPETPEPEPMTGEPPESSKE